MITITDAAAKKIRGLLEGEQKAPAEYGLRLGVVGGGCSGLSYRLAFDSPRPADQVFEKDGVRVLVDARSLLYVDQSTLDYTESLQGSQFRIENPNVKGSCGCGSSFNI